ncbi:hypothetical protein ACFX13_036360 [Malus domestica]
MRYSIPLCFFCVTMSDLPLDLFFKILLLLQPKDMIRCMCVSKAWNSSIRNQRFITIKSNFCRTIILNLYDPMHFLSLPLYDDDTLGTGMKIARPPLEQSCDSILGYSNGLLCIEHTYDNNRAFALWNPSIQKFKMIPCTTTSEPHLQQPSEMNDKLKKQGHYGFGYDSTNDDYKLVEVVEFCSIDKRHSTGSVCGNCVYEDMVVASYEVNVYSLKSKAWKRIQSMPPRDGFRLPPLQSVAVCLNSALSWKMDCHLDDDRPGMILTLDLASEKYREFPIPIRGDEDEISLGLVGGYLCICHRNFEVSDFQIDVWIMKEYGVTGSWNLLCSVEKSVDSHIKPLVFSKNGDMVLFEMDCEQLFWFDLEKKSAKVEFCREPGDFEVNVCEGGGSGSVCVLLDGDPVIVGRQQELCSTSEKEETFNIEEGVPSHMPVDLIRCMCVFKAWNASIRSQRFIQAHLQHSIKTSSSPTILLNPFHTFDFPMALPLYNTGSFEALKFQDLFLSLLADMGQRISNTPPHVKPHFNIGILTEAIVEVAAHPLRRPL